MVTQEEEENTGVFCFRTSCALTQVHNFRYLPPNCGSVLTNKTGTDKVAPMWQTSNKGADHRWLISESYWEVTQKHMAPLNGHSPSEETGQPQIHIDEKNHGSGCEQQVWRQQCPFPTEFGTHTHTRLTTLCPGLPGWADTRKVKPIWILLKQETVSGSGIGWAVCKSARSLVIYRKSMRPLGTFPWLDAVSF